MRVSITVQYGDNDFDITRSLDEIVTYNTNLNDSKLILSLLDETVETVKRAINATNK